LPADPSYSGDAAAANDPPMNQAVAAAGQSGGVSFAPPRRFRGEPAPVSQGAAAPSGYNNDGYAAAGSATAGGYSQNGGYAAPVSQPPITAVAAQAPIAQGPSEPGQYVVQPNDNFWTISEKVYGVGAFFKALQRFNAAEFPQSRRLQVGDVVAVPPTATLRQKFPDLCPKQKRERMASQMQPVAASPRHRLDAKIYVVEQGDTLFDIARRQLGKASRWPEIYELNRGTLGEDFDYLRAGTELVMPSDGQQPQDTLTRQPSDRFQR
jgi:nucleoid-associated protein YgaU